MSIEDLSGDPEAPRAREGSREAILDWLIPMERLLTSFPAATVTDEGRLWIGYGRELGPAQLQTSGAQASLTSVAPQDLTRVVPQEWIRLLDAEGHLLALATAGKIPGSLHPSVVLNYN